MLGIETYAERVTGESLYIWVARGLARKSITFLAEPVAQHGQRER